MMGMKFKELKKDLKIAFIHKVYFKKYINFSASEGFQVGLSLLSSGWFMHKVVI